MPELVPPETSRFQPPATAFRRKAAPVSPVAAHWDAGLGEFILPYAAVRAEDDPDAALCAFLETTYQAAADLAAWDREALECPRGTPRHPRWVG